MVDTKHKYTLVEIDKLQPGDRFSISKEIEDEEYELSNIVIRNNEDFSFVGIGVKTGIKLKWRMSDLVYVKAKS